jgi:ElaB protein
MQSHAQSNPVGREVQNVVNEAQELLKTVQTEGSDKLDEVKTKVSAQYDAARAKLGDLQTTVQDSAKAAVDTTDAYVRGNPWTAVAVAAAAGAVIGFIASRR